MLKINGLSKKFKNKKVLDNICVELDSGIYGLLGPNGAGKTTFMRTITGVYDDKKTITYDYVVVDQKFIRNNIGYLPQKFSVLKEMTVYEGLEYIGQMKKIPIKELRTEIDEMLERVHLTEEKDKKVGKLSGGMLRRMGIAQALLGDPKIIIFDEPTTGLDPEERIRFKNIVRTISKDKIVIISTHIVDDVNALCNKIVVMNHGQILFNDEASKLKNVAKGYIYEVEEQQFDESLGMVLIQIKEEKEKKMCRVYSKNPVGEKIDEVGIEDGYICVLKK